ncbi:hypothetical protein QZH41_004973 [Actinostola sp. cb2023]|nr:hypothetical protein QZH41_004973 [Actinostola sp. cb2023]
MAFGNGQGIPESLKVPLSSINPRDVVTAKQQLFAYQRSTATCEMSEDESLPSDVIKIQINESKTGVTALVKADFLAELKKLSSLDDPITQLEPIFIPTIHCGPSQDMLGNLYLEEDPLAADNEGDDETALQEQNEEQSQSTGLEDLNATVFYVVEPRHLEQFRSTLESKPLPPNNKIYFRYVVLPQNGRGIGVSRSIIKMLAECLELQFYWTIDDDIQTLLEFDRNSRRWAKCSFGRALLYGQRVLQDCTEKAMNDIDENGRDDLHDSLKAIIPEWAKETRPKAGRLMGNDESYEKVRKNLSYLNSPFTEKNMQADCGGDPVKIQRWQEAKTEFIQAFKDHLLKDTFKRIAGVSISNVHVAGRRFDYVSLFDGLHYRKCNQRYQMVLHNKDALKGFNYVPDAVVLEEAEATVDKPELRDVGCLGIKWEESSFCKALAFYEASDDDDNDDTIDDDDDDNGKSFVLNHLLRHRLSNDVILLPYGVGASKTPVPIKIKYGPDVVVTMQRKGKEADNSANDVLFSHLGGDDDLIEEEEMKKKNLIDSLIDAGKAIENVFQNQELTGVECIDVLAPLPVFQYLQDIFKEKCTYQNIKVEVEFVDLPGRGDSTGNALINNELDVADIIMLFKEGKSGRPVTAEDLAYVFKRRQHFEYQNRPKIVYLVNDDWNNSNDPHSEGELNRKREELDNAWQALLKKDRDKCYEEVYEKLPQTSAVNILEKLKKESEAIIFESKEDFFLESVGEAICQHVNNVHIKKNAHPVVQDIFKVTKQLRKQVTSLLTQKKKAIKGQELSESASKFKELGNRSFLVSLTDEDDDVLNNPPGVHEKLFDFFTQDHVMQHLLEKLKGTLQEHWMELLAMGEEVNKITLNDSGESFILFAEILCEGLVSKFMVKDGRGFITASVKRLSDTCLAEQKWWKDAEKSEEREQIIQFHWYEQVEKLAKLLEKGTRRQSLRKLLDDLLATINDCIKCGLKPDHLEIRKHTLELMLAKITWIISFSRATIREVNPHLSFEKDGLNSKSPFPTLKVKEDHGVAAFPPNNPTKGLQNVFTILRKKNGDPLSELQRKLNLPKGSLSIPEGSDEFKWAQILLNVLYDPNFHHMAFGNGQEIPESLKVPLSFISPGDVITAKQQLFAYQRSTATCEMAEDESLPSDVIKIQINESKTGVTALVKADFLAELKKLSSLDDPITQLEPIFIPTIHCGPGQDMLGNLHLEEDPWAADNEGVDETALQEQNEDNEGDDETALQEQNEEQSQSTGLEDLNATVFYVVEPRHLEQFRSTLESKPLPPNSKISCKYVVLPQNGRGIGVSRSIIKMLAECLELQFYWTIDDDIKKLLEFDRNSRRWAKCSFGRALLYGQRVLQDCTEKAMNDIDEDQRDDLRDSLKAIIPEWAKVTRPKAGRLMGNDNSYEKVRKNLSYLNSPFTEKNMQADCGGDPVKIQRWQETKTEFIQAFKDHLLKDTFKRIAGVSISNVAGRRYDYVSLFDGLHYRKSNQRYQMVLHNKDALKGFNYVPDAVVLEEAEATVDKPGLRDVPYLGMKCEDKSFSRALNFYGITGYQIFNIVMENKKLRNAFGRVGNSYAAEGNGDEPLID